MKTLRASKTQIGGMILALAGLLACGHAWGQDGITIKGDVTKIKVIKLIEVQEERVLVKTCPFELEGPAGGALYQWDVPPGVEAVKFGRILKVKLAPKGDITFSVAYAFIDKVKVELVEKAASISFIVGETVPAPKPIPDPIIIVPSTSPISEPGFRVLIVYETEALTPAINNIISGAAVRDYMNSKGAKDGATVAFRAFDKDVDPSMDMAWVQQAMKLPRTSIPWIVVSHGPAKGGFSGPLPATVAATVELLKKHGE